MLLSSLLFLSIFLSSSSAIPQLLQCIVPDDQDSVIVQKSEARPIAEGTGHVAQQYLGSDLDDDGEFLTPFSPLIARCPPDMVWGCTYIHERVMCACVRRHGSGDGGGNFGDDEPDLRNASWVEVLGGNFGTYNSGGPMFVMRVICPLHQWWVCEWINHQRICRCRVLLPPVHAPDEYQNGELQSQALFGKGRKPCEETASQSPSTDFKFDRLSLPYCRPPLAFRCCSFCISGNCYRRCWCLAPTAPCPMCCPGT